MSVRLLLFGSPTVECDARTFALPFERRNQLLAFLAFKRTWVGRAELASMLWPEQADKQAYTNLRKTLFRLQSTPWGGRIEVQGSSLRFAAETDVGEFETALRETRSADALLRYRGALLAGFDGEASEAWSGWLGFERDRLRSAWRAAALDHLASDIDAGAGIELSARLLDADPLDEAALGAHMSWLARGGQGARAREAYRDFVKRLTDDLGIAPGAGLRALHDALGAAAAPRVPESDQASGAASDGFVGRTVELRRIVDLLAQDECRLLCLVGPGGVGKTRLARRALVEFGSGFADGAFFVPLDDLTLPSELGGRLARELGIRLAGSAEPLQQVIDALHERQALLVLDNFEQLTAEAAMLERLTKACARLKVIVTSRVRLSVASEWSLPLEGLPCPEPEDQDRIEAFDAARLFLQAAQRVETGIVPSAQAAAILDICRQVEGLPLALELAAAWTRVLSCAEIADLLRQGTELLHAVDAAHPPRHASIKVVFDHSWGLLTAPERDALSRLSVFRGGFSAEAARAVGGTPLPVLGALTDKSLLRKDGGRLSLHSLIRQLAAERLDKNARAATERAHALYFHRVLAQLQPAVLDGDRDALQTLDLDLENCRSAWRWAIAQQAVDALATSATTLLDFWDHRGRHAEGLSLLGEALASAAVTSAAKVNARLLGAASHVQYRLDRYTDAEATAKRALAASRGRPDRETNLQCLKTLAGCCLRLGRHAEARSYYERILEIAAASDDTRNVAAMLDNVALIEKAMGHFDAALRLSLESLAQHRRLADAAGEALCLNNLADLYLYRREYASAGAQLRAGLAICDRHGLLSTRTLILTNVAEVEMKTGNFAAAESHSRRAFEAAEASGNRSVACMLHLQFAQFALKRDDVAAARAELGMALKIAISIGRPSLKLVGLMTLAEVLEAQGEPHCARRVLAFAADHPSTSAADRGELLSRMTSIAGAGSPPPWPGIELDELAQRVVVEGDIAYAPLIAALRAAGRAMR